MAYQGQLPGGVTVTIEGRGDQTQVNVERGGQRQGSGRTTGRWTQAPKLWRTEDGGVVEIGADEKGWLRITAGGAQSLDRAPDLKGAQAVALTEVQDGEGQPEMKPMAPMKPMKPLGED
ncbi:hypothetical protein [Deinococcus petrolearius]|uniref:Uncharacterized protein n=1 Tax=Deinococcus petrolearius TaxID=1751295 RepID=A0ABW1DGU8_9DEIO